MTFVELAANPGLTDSHPIAIIATVLKYVRENVAPMQSATKKGLHVRVAGATILAACYRPDIATYASERVPIAEGAHAEYFMQQVGTRLQMRFGTSIADPRLTFLQILCTQGSLQTNDAFCLFRTLYLLELQDFNSGRNDSHYDELFRNVYDCSVAEYVAMLELLWITAMKGEFVASTSVRLSPQAQKLKPIVENILAAHSCKIQDVQPILDGEIGHHGLDGVVAAFFARYPFVEFRPGVYFPAPHPYLRCQQ